MLDLNLILKNNELCLVGQPRGRVSAEQSGLFVRDTRFLNRLDVTFAGKPLTILDVQMTRPDQAIITATNPEDHTDGGITGHTILFRVDLRLTSELTCTLTTRNHGRSRVTGDLAVRLGADFRDMFTVRGMTPKRPVTLESPHVDGTSATLAATGSDGSSVSTRIVARDAVSLSTLGDSDVEARFAPDLQPGASAEWPITITPQPFGEPLRDVDSFGPDAGYTPHLSLRTSSHRLDAFVARCDADLALLQTTFPDGNIPAAGIPWYISPFGRDSLIVALQTMHLYPVRSEHTLRLLATLQGTKYDPFREEAPGKILHEIRYGDMARTGQIPHTPYYGSIDSTPLFVMTFARHYRWHRDDVLYDVLIDHVRRALEWMESDGDPDGDGLLEFAGEQLDMSHISQQGWKDSGDSLNFADGRPVRGPIALVEVQGYAWAAYAWLADAARLRGDTGWADELDRKAATLRERVEGVFWMEDAQFYAQALDGEKTPVDAISSNPGHLLYVGLPSQERADAVARRFAAPDMNSGWGIRTLSTDMATYNPMSYHNGSVWPHDVSLAMAGLAAYGHHDLARDLALSITDVASHDPELRIAELYCGFPREADDIGPVNYPVSCLPQAWAAGAGILAATTLLGIGLDDSGAITAAPNLPDDWDHIVANGFRRGTRVFNVSAAKTNGSWDTHITEA